MTNCPCAIRIPLVYWYARSPALTSRWVMRDMDPECHHSNPEVGLQDSFCPAHSEEEFRELRQKLAELRAQGILSGGDGPRETLRPVARVPGGLERFLAERE